MQLMVLPQPAPPPQRSPAVRAVGRDGAAKGGRDLLGELLREQQELTAVQRFAAKQGRGDLPSQAKHYRDLIPLTTPGAGQQYAFDVDLDACTGCKACVTACHNLNGLDDDETWRDVGLLVGGTTELPIIQHVTTACHHCVEPACLEGCPVLAYDKDPVTGIVKHLDDQCIGCQYCIFKCPYDVPKYNAKRGIVRKCDMCSDRLAIGEAPACAQACPNQAIRISIVNRAKVIEDSEVNVFLPGAPEPDYTLPATTYRTKRVMPRNMLPADYHGAAPQHVHVPLVAMLVLTQLSVGAFLVERLLTAWSPGVAASGPFHAIVSLALGMLALGASTLHLGRPLYAFRAIIGLRTSWLSREIVVFGAFAAMAAAYAGASLLLADHARTATQEALSTGVIITGLIGVFCSAMIYHDTRRDFWSLPQTGTKFALTTILLGAATMLLTSAFTSAATETQSPHRILCHAIAITCGVKLLFEATVLRHLSSWRNTPQKRTARLLIGRLARLTLARVLLGLLGGVVIPLLVASEAHAAVAPAVMIFALTLMAELLERTLYFAAVVAPKMPGGPST